MFQFLEFKKEPKQYSHVRKVLVAQELPPKNKHVRAIILATYEEKSSTFFYMSASRYPLGRNPILRWKFLYMIYKLIRDGHRSCIQDALARWPTVACLAPAIFFPSPFFEHSRYPCGSLLQLLERRLNLHKEFDIKKGDLNFNPKELKLLLRSSPDFLYNLFTELMGILEKIIQIESAISTSIQISNTNQYTLPAQCAMAPILPCLQDAIAIYELTSRILQKLHGKVDHALLIDLRKLFNTRYTQLRNLFSKPILKDYCHSVVELPILPPEPPDFCRESEQPQNGEVKILIHDSGASEYVDHSNVNQNGEWKDCRSAADSSDILGIFGEESGKSPEVANVGLELWDPWTTNLLESNPFDNLEVKSGDENVDSVSDMEFTAEDEKQDLVIQIELLKSEVDRLQSKRDDAKLSLLDRIKTLESEAHDSKKKIASVESECERLMGKVENCTNELEINRIKFTKMKNAYCGLREKHLALLREHNDIKLALEDQKESNRKLENEIQQTVSGLARVSLSEIEADAAAPPSTIEGALLGLKTQQEKSEEMIERLKSDALQSAKIVDDLKTEIRSLHVEKQQLEESLQRMEMQKSEAHMSLHAAEERCAYLESRLENLPKLTADKVKSQLLKRAVAHATLQMQDNFLRMDNEEAVLGFRGSPEVLESYADRSYDLLAELKTKMDSADTESTDLPLLVQSYASAISETLFHSMVTPGTTANLTNTKDPLQLGQDSIELFKQLDEKPTDCSSLVASLLSKLGDFRNSVRELRHLDEGTDQLDDDQLDALLRAELAQTAEAIRMAETKFQNLSEVSAADTSSAELRSHHPILERCSGLMAAISHFITRCSEAQKSLKDTRPKGHSYKKHSRWAQGFVSAAKSVGACANFLVEVVDQIVEGNEHSLERLLVTSQEVMYSTTHVFVASRVKLPPDSTYLGHLHEASTQISQATGYLLSAVKSAIQTRESKELEFGSLTLTQAKRMEVEIRASVLRLEADLHQERLRLARIRKENYKNAADIESIPSSLL